MSAARTRRPGAVPALANWLAGGFATLTPSRSVDTTPVAPALAPRPPAVREASPGGAPVARGPVGQWPATGPRQLDGRAAAVRGVTAPLGTAAGAGIAVVDDGDTEQEPIGFFRRAGEGATFYSVTRAEAPRLRSPAPAIRERARVAATGAARSPAPRSASRRAARRPRVAGAAEPYTAGAA